MYYYYYYCCCTNSCFSSGCQVKLIYENASEVCFSYMRKPNKSLVKLTIILMRCASSDYPFRTRRKKTLLNKLFLLRKEST